MVQESIAFRRIAPRENSVGPYIFSFEFVYDIVTNPISFISTDMLLALSENLALETKHKTQNKTKHQVVYNVSVDNLSISSFALCHGSRM